MYELTARRPDPYKDHHDRLASFLEDALPVRIIAHITFPWPISQEELDGALRRLIARVQQQHRLTVGYIAGMERWPTRHLHVVLVAKQPLSIPHVEGAIHLTIRELAAATGRYLPEPARFSALVHDYSTGGGGLSYVMKSEEWDGCNVRYSENLALLSGDARDRATSARERRLARRIAAQAAP
jgi:hypothetical protein